MAVDIPVQPSLDNYRERVLLDGKLFDLAFYWNERDEAWYLTIYESSQPRNDDGSRDAVLASIKIVLNYGLLGQFQDRRRPLGEFIAVDTEGSLENPGRRELGRRVLLRYYSTAELAALGIRSLVAGSQTEP